MEVFHLWPREQSVMDASAIFVRHLISRDGAYFFFGRTSESLPRSEGPTPWTFVFLVDSGATIFIPGPNLKCL